MADEVQGGQYKFGDGAAKLWFLFAGLWFPFFATFGFLLAVKFFFPEFLGTQDWLTFGHVRPAHVNGVLFGFVSSGLLGAMFWIVPRLCARPLYRPQLAKTIPFIWNASIVAGIIWIMLGGSQGREYAELPWAIDVLVMLALLLMAYVVFGAIIKRREKKLYVSLWYYAGTMIWFPIVYFIGNVMWNVPGGALNGIQDAIFNWYYGHNVLGLWFTTLGIPAWYYFIPRIIKRPLYSHLLSLIAFFTIAFFYTGVGGHHLLQAPIPEWLKTIAVIMSVLMLVPVITFATNILLTMRGSWSKLGNNVPLQFIFAGFVMYILASIQGSFQALRDTNAFLHFSQWPVGHSHLALLGGFGFLALGLVYWLTPRLTGRQVYSFKLMRLSFWTLLIGFTFFFLAMTIAGLVANSNWWQHINVVETLPTLRIHFIWRAISGGAVVIGAFIFGYNLLLTFLRRGPAHAWEEHPAPEPVTNLAHSAFMRRSQERLNLPIITIGGLVVFTIMTFMVVAMPYMFTPDAPSDRAHELTPVEEHGKELYLNLGCFYCHSQQVRPQDWARGEISEAGDFYYSSPHFLGTERTGPNLAQIGGKRPTEWHIVHHTDPRSVSPSSIMPSFAFLPESDLEALAAYVQNLGSYDLEPQAFQPLVPEEYRDKMNPYMPLMMQVRSQYDTENEEFSGEAATAQQWVEVFEEGKALYAEKCISCHGCSGNGEGPYARNVVTRPANLHERLSNYPDPDAPFHFWRVSEGVPGTAMPPWGWSLSEDTIWRINTYEMSFIGDSLRTVSGDISDEEGDVFARDVSNAPYIAGTEKEFQQGKQLYEIYCAQCHGDDGMGDGPASIASYGGYIRPEPANFEESGSDFELFGRYTWKVTEGVETTNMPPWKYALSDHEIAMLVFYIQGFSTAEDYNAKWADLYTDPFARNLKR